MTTRDDETPVPGHADGDALTEAERELSLLLRQTAREHLRLSDGDYWPSDVADAQARAVIAARGGDAAAGDGLRAAVGRHRLVSLPVDDLLMALNYEGSDPPEQDAAPAWKAAHDRVLASIYGPGGYTCPTVCVEQNHPGREHDDWLAAPARDAEDRAREGER